MALFTDAAVITLDDLSSYENTIVQVASSHDINVDTKILLATGSVSDRLLLWLLSLGMSDPQHLVRRRIGLSTVVVLPTLRRWLTFESLARVYGEAYNLQLNTRFQGKWTEYQKETSKAAEAAFHAGIGIVYNALPKPGMPLISVQTGNSPAAALFVQTTWIDSLGRESAASPVNGVILPAGSAISVAMAEGSVNTPSAALGWNVYIGVDQGAVTLQNSETLSVGSTWELPATGVIAGEAVTDGQQPDYYIGMSKQILRG